MGSSKQASDYEVTAEFVVNHIKKTFEHGLDVFEALRNVELPYTNLWKTKLQVSELKDPDGIAGEDAQSRMEYKTELDETVRRVRALKGNLIKSYALLWERCAKAMQNKIQTRSDYQSVIFNDPIKLLEAIKQHALNFVVTQNAM